MGLVHLEDIYLFVFYLVENKLITDQTKQFSLIAEKQIILSY